MSRPPSQQGAPRTAADNRGAGNQFLADGHGDQNVARSGGSLYNDHRQWNNICKLLAHFSDVANPPESQSTSQILNGVCRPCDVLLRTLTGMKSTTMVMFNLEIGSASHLLTVGESICHYGMARASTALSFGRPPSPTE